MDVNAGIEQDAHGLIELTEAKRRRTDDDASDVLASTGFHDIGNGTKVGCGKVPFGEHTWSFHLSDLRTKKHKTAEIHPFYKKRISVMLAVAL